MSIRVLLWGELFWPYVGGAELFAAALMRSLHGGGFDFTVVTSHDHLELPDQDHYRGIPIHRFAFRSALAPNRIDEILALRRRVAALVRRTSPHVIHANGVGPSTFFCMHAARAAGVPLLVRANRDLDTVPSPPLAGTLTQNALSRAAWVVAASERLLAQVRAIAPGIAATSSLIYNGVDVPPRAPASPRRDPPRILCLGRLVRDKGFDLAIDALATIRLRAPEARLVIAGDGPERGALEQQAAALGLAGSVDFTGWVAPGEVEARIADATLLAMPSRTEGLPNVALQAAAGGRAVVASRVGGLPEIVRHGETGFLVDLDPAALAHAIACLLEDPTGLDRMGLAAWRRAHDVFGQQRCVESFAALYRRLAGQQ